MTNDEGRTTNIGHWSFVLGRYLQRKMMIHFRRELARNGRWLDQQVRGWLGLLWGAAQKTLKPNSVIRAAAIAYFALFSLFPVILLSMSIASFRFGELMEAGQVVKRLEFIAPALGQLLGQNIDDIILARGPMTSIALVGLIWSCSTIFYILTNSLNEIWGVTYGRAVWRQRGWAIILVLIFVVPLLFLASFASSLLATLQTLLPALIIQIADSVSLGIAILLDVALFMVLYLILPHGDARWREILPGALAAGLLWELGKKTFLAFITAYILASNLVYGSVAAIIGFLTWAYLSGLIFLFGAYLNVAYRQLNRER
jgi:membrane protein